MIAAASGGPSSAPAPQNACRRLSSVVAPGSAARQTLSTDSRTPMPHPVTTCASTNATKGGRVARYSPDSTKAPPPAVRDIRVPSRLTSAPVLRLDSTKPAEKLKKVIPIVARLTS